MMKNTTKTAAVATGTMLFDDWFDPIEDTVRETVRSVIETIMEEELDATLSRPRYGRRKAAGSIDDAAPIVGSRHGHRTRTLTGVRTNRDRRAARPYQGRGRQGDRVEEQGAAGLPAAHETSRSSDRGCLSFRDQHAPRASRAFGGFQRRGGQGCGQPHLAQGEGRLGCLERALTEG